MYFQAIKLLELNFIKKVNYYLLEVPHISNSFLEIAVLLNIKIPAPEGSALSSPLNGGQAPSIFQTG